MADSVPKQVIVFGATGMTGLSCIAAAKKAGCHVTAFVRNPARLPDGTLVDSVIVGDVLDQQAINNAVKGKDGILVALGTGTDLSPTTVMSEGTKNIIKAMQLHQIQRIVVCISAFLFWERSKVPAQFIPVTEDHERQSIIVKSSDRDWVIVCPPHIIKDPGRGNYAVDENKTPEPPVKENQKQPYRRISVHDLADFMVKNLMSSEFLHKVMGLNYLD